jgi:hypothetical protein
VDLCGRKPEDCGCSGGSKRSRGRRETMRSGSLHKLPVGVTGLNDEGPFEGHFDLGGDGGGAFLPGAWDASAGAAVVVYAWQILIACGGRGAFAGVGVVVGDRCWSAAHLSGSHAKPC